MCKRDETQGNEETRRSRSCLVGDAIARRSRGAEINAIEFVKSSATGRRGFAPGAELDGGDRYELLVGQQCDRGDIARGGGMLLVGLRGACRGGLKSLSRSGGEGGAERRGDPGRRS